MHASFFYMLAANAYKLEVNSNWDNNRLKKQCAHTHKHILEYQQAV